MLVPVWSRYFQQNVRVSFVSVSRLPYSFCPSYFLAQHGRLVPAERRTERSQAKVSLFFAIQEKVCLEILLNFYLHYHIRGIIFKYNLIFIDFVICFI